MNIDYNAADSESRHFPTNPMMTEKSGFNHFMQKEIFEQARTVRDILRSSVSVDSARVFLNEMNISEQEIRNLTNVKIVACGSSWHAGQIGKFMLDEIAGIPVEVDYASESCRRNAMVDSKTLTICISQSGETADTLDALREAKRKGSKTLAICNVPGSPLTREAAGTILTHAEPEVSIASTKAFSGQLAALMLTAIYIGRIRETLSEDQSGKLLQEFARIPHKMEKVLYGNESGIYGELAQQFFRHINFLYLGRGVHFPIALEGALKLKEISYIHAEGCPAGEINHGPKALIDENMPVVMLATRDEEDAESMARYRKCVSNIKEIKACGGIVISVVTDGDQLASEVSDHVIEVPSTTEIFAPLLEVIPLQLLAYHIAVRRGCAVDRPRNLAKAVIAA